MFFEIKKRQNLVHLLSLFPPTELEKVNFAVSCFRGKTRNSYVFGPKNEFRDEFRQIHLRVEALLVIAHGLGDTQYEGR